MILKLRDLKRLAATSKHQSKKMQHRLLLYYCSMVLVIFSASLLIMSIAGVFSNSEEKLGQILKVRQDAAYSAVTNHLDSLEAQSIALSKSACSIISDALDRSPVSTLNDNPEELLKTQKLLYPTLNTTLKSSGCNGAYIILNATTNTSAPVAATSRSGLYLRYVNLSATNSIQQDVTFYRGIPDVARDIPLELHNRWNLEFDISKIPAYETLVKTSSGRLADNCLWSKRMLLPGTWENLMLLSVPILNENGEIYGICGLEISQLYFRLAYPSASSEFGNMVTVLAPIDGDVLSLKDGLIGSRQGMHIDEISSLYCKKGDYYNTYLSNDKIYLGLHQEINVKSTDGNTLAAVTLISAEAFASVVNHERMIWIFCALVFLLLMVLFSLYLSRRFVKPILKKLDAIRNNTWDEDSAESYYEIDDLFGFLAEKDREYEQTKTALETAQSESAKAHTEHEQTLRALENAQREAAKAQIEYEQAQNNYMAAQQKIARLAHSKKYEIDPDDYQEFLIGVQMLTPTERVIFDHYLSGKNVKEIMNIVGIKESTLRYHNRNIYSKLGVNSLKQMLLYAALMKQEGEGGFKK
ncbi:LuxR C-terminal-related transcriptional regulator [Christensenella sp. MSJ-20]|uniref:LuxR C-terminal-related transcriptional regulator n=1 Tax=Christensenella sp. MSJ-20 TaxID=2841518 RepID=UPI001C7632EB|nr:LuxR C-terminal-related transcriptional regulator [Christensenella sp. MSJ-20]